MKTQKDQEKLLRTEEGGREGGRKRNREIKREREREEIYSDVVISERF